MTQEEGYLLIEKFVRHKLSEAEAKKLLQWIEADSVHADYFYNVLEINHRLDDFATYYDAEEAYPELKKLLQKPVKKASNRALFIRYAAIFIGIILVAGAYYYFQNNAVQPTPSTPVSSQQIVLKMGDGNVQKIAHTSQQKIKNDKGQVIGIKTGNTITYNNTPPTQKLVYNEIFVPKGKQFKLVLSDGTEIWLNAETTLKYPIHFIPGKKRTVFLDGEAYFHVATDSSRQFLVKSNYQTIAVYGTQFNISAYKDDAVYQTVLVKGSVGVFVNGKKTMLTPGHMAITRATSTAVKIMNVRTEDYTSWIGNDLQFTKISFAAMTKILEHKYNIVIHNRYKALNEQRFTANFKGKTIKQVLDLLTQVYPFAYTINHDSITITPRN